MKTSSSRHPSSEDMYARSRELLGGSTFSRRKPASRTEIHSTLVAGVPYGALLHLVDSAKGLDEDDIARVLGISTRTLRRQVETPERPMPVDLASKAWLLAETLAKAAEVFGGKDEAEDWMSSRALGLDNERPIDLLQTVQGAEVVGDFLGRLEYGVYT